MSNVLIVDDDPDVAHVLSQGLQEIGCTCSIVGDGSAALDALAMDKVDVVVTDVCLPGKLSGIDLASRATAAGIACVLVTGQDQAMFELDRSHHVWLQKPFRLRDLGEAVAEALRRAKERSASL